MNLNYDFLRIMKDKVFFPAEWHPQSAIQLTWPHSNSDWDYMIEEVTVCFVNLATAILNYENLLIVCNNKVLVKSLLESNGAKTERLSLIEIPSNDTWARDHGAISILKNGKKVIYDFTFNGWGLKFASDKDNQISKAIYTANKFEDDVVYESKKNFVLEGGGIESDGKGTLLTTSECLLSPNRNSYMSKEQIEEYLKEIFGMNRVLWIDYGYLAGDDTDSHIDTLARFCDEHTIAYVKCEDERDEHFEALAAMEKQLMGFVDNNGNPYKFIALPMAKEVHDENGERLPATYANFLILNGAVLMPFYNDKETDELARRQLQQAFPNREVVGIECSALICQHGSLHCVTMQYPEGFIK